VPAFLNYLFICVHSARNFLMQCARWSCVLGTWGELSCGLMIMLFLSRRVVRNCQMSGMRMPMYFLIFI